MNDEQKNPKTEDFDDEIFAPSSDTINEITSKLTTHQNKSDEDVIDERSLFELDGEDLDVDSALEAVSGLGEITASIEREQSAYDESDIPEDFREEFEFASEERLFEDSAIESRQFEEQEYPFTETDAEDEFQDFSETSQAYSEEPQLILETPLLPPMLEIHRGQFASAIPAILLMALGGWLTFMLTTSELSFTRGEIIAILAGGFGLALLSQWVTSRRWSRGNFFIGILTILFGGGVVYLTQSDSFFDTNNGWTLLIVLIGIAFVLTGLLAQPRSKGLMGIGLIVSLLGGLIYVFNSSLDLGEFTATIEDFWIIPIAFLLLVLIAPILGMIFRRGKSAEDESLAE